MASSTDVPGPVPSRILSSDLDFLTMIERGYEPPIAFKTRSELDKWRVSRSLTARSIGKRDAANDVIEIVGKIRSAGYDDGLFYQQIWVSASYQQYRTAFSFQLRATNDSLDGFATLDGDHAVGSARLLRVWPNAWVNLILAKRSINRSIGAMLEKYDLSVGPSDTKIDMNAECMLKTFSSRKATSREDLFNCLDDAAKRILPERGKEGAKQQFVNRLMSELSTTLGAAGKA